MPPLTNYSSAVTSKDYSLFLPAMSPGYAQRELIVNPKKTFPINPHELDFLDNTTNLFHYPAMLYSAGQAAQNPKSAQRTLKMYDPILRNQSTVFIGDSGGYQIETNVIKWTGDELRERMLRWLEKNCTHGMTLDFPTKSINKGTILPHLKRMEEEGVNFEEVCNQHGLQYSDPQQLSFAACLQATIQNNEYFQKHRVPNALKLLNVLQGRNRHENDIWYNAVKHYGFEGWALAGPYKENFELTMRRLITLRDDKMLEPGRRDWIHILGVGKVTLAPIYSTMQQELQKQTNPNLRISYDCSSPLMRAAQGDLMVGYNLSKKGWGIVSISMPDGRPHFNKGMTMQGLLAHSWAHNRCKGTQIHSEISKLVLVDNLCVDKDHSWDQTAFVVGMNHNLQVQIESSIEAQRVYHSNNAAHITPNSMLVMKQLIPEIFKSENPMTLISSHRKALTALASKWAKDGVLAHNHFEF